jgi:hypothetical protein
VPGYRHLRNVDRDGKIALRLCDDAKLSLGETGTGVGWHLSGPPLPRREASISQLALQQADGGPHRVAFGTAVIGDGDAGLAIAELMVDVLAGLATVVTETMKAGAATVKVERYRITDDGRTALE